MRLFENLIIKCVFTDSDFTLTTVLYCISDFNVSLRSPQASLWLKEYEKCQDLLSHPDVFSGGAEEAEWVLWEKGNKECWVGSESEREWIYDWAWGWCGCETLNTELFVKGGLLAWNLFQEAASLISQRSVNPRDLFKQMERGSSVSNGDSSVSQPGKQTSSDPLLLPVKVCSMTAMPIVCSVT